MTCSFQRTVKHKVVRGGSREELLVDIRVSPQRSLGENSESVKKARKRNHIT